VVFSGGWLSGSGEVPTAEAVVGWLLEHHELQVAGDDLSDSEPVSDVDGLSDLESILDEVEDNFCASNEGRLPVGMSLSTLLQFFLFSFLD